MHWWAWSMVSVFAVLFVAANVYLVALVFVRRNIPAEEERMVNTSRGFQGDIGEYLR